MVYGCVTCVYVQACADKLRMEMNDYGYPPVFPEEVVTSQPSERDDPVVIDKSKAKKVKQVQFWVAANRIDLFALPTKINMCDCDMLFNQIA
jgi:hypothetical protein